MLERAAIGAATEPAAATGLDVPAALSLRDAWQDRARRLAGRLSATDRAALGYWLLAHVALLVLAYAAAWTFRDNTSAHLPLTGAFEHWDANLYRDLARYGYFGGPDGRPAHPNQAAFLPGYPLALAAVHAVVRNWMLAELLLSLTAGAVAVVSLARLTGDRRAALFLLCAPSAVFLMVGYSESLFLAFALPAWLAAKRGNWPAAAAFGFLAAFTRIDGLFLLPALALMALTGARGARLDALVRLLPAAIAPLMYEVYLRAATGTWNAWMAANSKGWGLGLSWPWLALRETWRAAFEHTQGTDYAWDFQLELWCMAAGVALTVVLLVLRQCPEALYVGAMFGALACSNWWQSNPRSWLLAFPAFVLLARSRLRWAGPLYVAVCAPLAAVEALLYLSGRWAG
jgi:hypothetical protein